MIKPLTRLVIAASALALTLGPVTGTASAASSTTVYHQSDSGKTVSMTVGTKFKVRLKACEDCGDSWHWKVRPDAKVIKVVSKHDVSSATPPAVGGTNTITWTFKVVGSGDTNLELVKRSAQKGNKVTKTFTLYVAAGPASGLPAAG